MLFKYNTEIVLQACASYIHFYTIQQLLVDTG